MGIDWLLRSPRAWGALRAGTQLTLPHCWPLRAALPRLPPATRVPAVFSITDARKQVVDFLYPSYYSAGAAVFAPGGAIEGVARWEDMSGRTVAVPQGYYALEAAAATPALAGINFVVAANAEGTRGRSASLRHLCRPPPPSAWHARCWPPPQPQGCAAFAPCCLQRRRS